MDTDEENNIYVCDARRNSIVVFDRDGRFVREIGRRGEGPGEFEMPFEFCYDNGKLFVWDQGNRRVQILDSLGNYLGGFRVFRALQSISQSDSMIITHQIYNQNEATQFALITLMDREGHVKKSFGSSINQTINMPRLPPGASDVLLKVYKDRVYALFQYYPVLRVYSLDGTLLEAFRFRGEIYRDLVQDNYDMEKVLESYPSFLRLRFLFLAFDVSPLGIFIGLYKDDIEIHHYNFDGKLENIFVYKHPGEGFYLRGIKADRLGEAYAFHVLNLRPLPRVEVYVSGRQKGGG
jgi:hypothetical protein